MHKEAREVGGQALTMQGLVGQAKRLDSVLTLSTPSGPLDPILVSELLSGRILIICRD